MVAAAAGFTAQAAGAIKRREMDNRAGRRSTDYSLEPEMMGAISRIIGDWAREWRALVGLGVVGGRIAGNGRLGIRGLGRFIAGTPRGNQLGLGGIGRHGSGVAFWRGLGLVRTDVSPALGSGRRGGSDDRGP